MTRGPAAVAAAGIVLALAAGACSRVCECPTIYDPVCGADGRTYGNACAAGCEDVEIVHEGACALSGGACEIDSDCTDYRDGVGGCCGACLASSMPRPDEVACFAPCQERFDCGCAFDLQCRASPAAP